MKPQELLNIKFTVDSDKPGIYLIYCIISNKGYIGQSKNIKARIRRHKYDLKLNKHRNNHLQNSYNLHGLESFNFIPLENCEYRNLAIREEYYLNLIDMDLRYNLAAVMEVHVTSEETRKKMSESAKKVIHGPLSEEHKQNLSQAHKGKALSEEHKQKIAESHMGEKNHYFGKKHSEETKAKMREAWKNRGPVSEETIKKRQETIMKRYGVLSCNKGKKLKKK
jgi:group I intron endonuclease